ncbi:hypothetical protein ABTX86_31090, partial [Streptomyces anulatus]|uniref:hypothetical protein n=1 Tax=Streptomyces anulatus TaxID=1892 RepID=UPI00331E00DB
MSQPPSQQPPQGGFGAPQEPPNGAPQQPQGPPTPAVPPQAPASQLPDHVSGAEDTGQVGAG